MSQVCVKAMIPCRHTCWRKKHNFSHFFITQLNFYFELAETCLQSLQYRRLYSHPNYRCEHLHKSGRRISSKLMGGVGSRVSGSRDAGTRVQAHTGCGKMPLCLCMWLLQAQQLSPTPPSWATPLSASAVPFLVLSPGAGCRASLSRAYTVQWSHHHLCAPLHMGVFVESG